MARMAAPKTTVTEDLTNAVDGVVTAFTIAGGPFIPGSLVVEHNGIRLRSGAAYDFIESPTYDGFTLCFVARVGDSLQVQYEFEDIGAGFPLIVASGIDC